MSFYTIRGEVINLNPLDNQSFSDIAGLLADKEFIAASMIHDPALNLGFTYRNLKRSCCEEGFQEENRLYIIDSLEEKKPIGIAGLHSIDWHQRRAELILIMDKSSRKRKLSYEPVKLLSYTAVKEWGMRKLWIKLYPDDTQTMTVLKGFGFEAEGEMKEYAIVGGEAYSILLFGLLARDLRIVEA
ncbi:MAG: GNAT family N-acetyltransferase [Spirochaetales bacterium]|nr:GNAT family N-acetyltransferase [Spirochaetales bacterium]